MERPTIAPAGTSFPFESKDGAVAGKGAEKKMSKFRMRQLGLTDDNDM